MRITHVRVFDDIKGLNLAIIDRRQKDESFEVIDIKPYLEQSKATKKYLVRRFLLIYSFDTKSDFFGWNDKG